MARNTMFKRIQEGIKEEQKRNGNLYKYFKSYVERHGKAPPQKNFYKTIVTNNIRKNSNYYQRLKRMRMI